MNKKTVICAIDTSADETSAAVTEGNRVLSSVTFSQILEHSKWGGVVPDIARRNHQERIDDIVDEAVRKSGKIWNDIDAIAVTYGPGLAIALGVGIDKAKNLALTYRKPLIPINHMEGHIYSCFAANSKGNPQRNIQFPCLAVLVSGGHTELVVMRKHVDYEVIGQTRDDAAGEALDKAARIILKEHVYPGGPIIERLAKTGKDNYFNLPVPMVRSNDLDFSFSGIKTALLYHVQRMGDNERLEHMADLSATFQRVVVKSILDKLEKALELHAVNSVVMGGGVAANELLRSKVRGLCRSRGIKVYFPYKKALFGDNAAMIGVAASYRGLESSVSPESIERNARASLNDLQI